MMIHRVITLTDLEQDTSEAIWRLEEALGEIPGLRVVSGQGRISQHVTLPESSLPLLLRMGQDFCVVDEYAELYATI